MRKRMSSYGILGIVEGPPTPTQADAIEELVSRSQRKRAVQIRKTFLQQNVKGRPIPGPLHAFVRSHDERALDLYLLVRLVAVRKPYQVAIEAGGWARALGLPRKSGPETVSRIWRRIADLQLITRRRQSRTACVTLLREDGSGRPYVSPSGTADTGDTYLNIPLEYWTEGWYSMLGLAGKAMLLIALSLGDGFYLPVEKVKDWYGLSADTATRGLAQLQKCRILVREQKYKKAPLTALGWTFDYRYTLQPPFGPRNPEGPQESKGGVS